MTGQELATLMEEFDVFDNALLYHAYKNYRRDYELIVQVHVGPVPQGTYSYLFRYCVEADVRTSLPPDIYRQSLDDRLIDYENVLQDGWTGVREVIFPRALARHVSKFTANAIVPLRSFAVVHGYVSLPEP